jgi:hypothetical protein
LATANLCVVVLIHEIILVAEVVGIDVDIAESLCELLLRRGLELAEEILECRCTMSVPCVAIVAAYARRPTLLDCIVDRRLVS